MACFAHESSKERMGNESDILEKYFDVIIIMWFFFLTILYHLKTTIDNYLFLKFLTFIPSKQDYWFCRCLGQWPTSLSSF